ncbi:MAG TPA: 5'/3'-nucleotidase SurE [Bacteroidales bacterium]|nr:5'/3'-nucleotidase SurE [Bacteroidales bacterium]
MKPLFLISNDDGIHARGIRCLIDVLRPLGDMLVVAPETERSGMSTAFTLREPLTCKPVSKEEGLIQYSSNGTPVDCIKLALNLLTDERKPDLIIAGINHGFNGSIAIHYSGTMGAVLEGCMAGYPSIGFSIDDHREEANFEPSLPHIRNIVQAVLDNGLPYGVCLNVNIPKHDEIKGTKICRQGKGRWVEEFIPCSHPDNAKRYWLTGKFLNLEENAGDNDLTSMRQGYISVVPSCIDVTNHSLIGQLQTWEL